MKRLICLVIMVVLALSVVCAASADGVQFKTEYFSLQLPDGWSIDTDDLESEEGQQCLGFFYGPENVTLGAGVYLSYYEEEKDVALWNYDDEKLNAYANDILEIFKDSNAELVGIVKAGKIPLVVIKCSDAEGEFVYADTMTNGYAIQFEFYVTDENAEKMYPITNEHIEQIKNILATFQPAA